VLIVMAVWSVIVVLIVMVVWCDSCVPRGDYCGLDRDCLALKAELLKEIYKAEACSCGPPDDHVRMKKEHPQKRCKGWWRATSRRPSAGTGGKETQMEQQIGTPTEEGAKDEREQRVDDRVRVREEQTRME
jgi:hypothetical protein